MKPNQPTNNKLNLWVWIPLASIESAYILDSPKYTECY